MKKINLALVLLGLFSVFTGAAFASSDINKISIAPIIKKVSPAIVSIYATNKKLDKDLNSEDNVDYLLEKQKGDNYSIGSGVIVSDDGLVVTNAHVVADRANVVVILKDGREIIADILVVNKSIDLSLLRLKTISKEKFTYLPLNDDDTLEVGDFIVALGNPFGIGQTATTGIVSGFRNFEDSDDESLSFAKLIQIDAAINPGNSGGALVDFKGNLVGINCMIYSANGDNNSGIGFAIPVKVVNLFVKRSLSGLKVKKYWLGLNGVSVDSKIAHDLGLKYPKGVYIYQVHKSGPAGKAGINAGDVILKVDDKDIDDMSDLAFLVANIDDSTVQKYTLYRDGKVFEKSLKPEYPEENPSRDLITFKEGVFSGLTIVNNSQAVAYEINASVTDKDKVVVYDVNNESLFKRLGIEVGDIILEINDVKMKSTADVKKFISKNTTENYRVLIQRKDNTVIFNISNK